MSNWTLFSNHGHVLVCLARNSNARLRDVAADVGITERAVQKIVRDLQDGGMISITKIGRRNGYRIHKKQTLRHRLEANCKLRDLIKLVNKDREPELNSEALVNESRQTGSRKPGTRKNELETGLASDRKPASTKSEKIKAKPAKEAESGESEFSDSIERQQGSLF
jgi:DNA-binding MarR family transcriptional regulator